MWTNRLASAALPCLEKRNTKGHWHIIHTFIEDVREDVHQGLGEMNDSQRGSCSHVRCRHFASGSCSEWCVNTSRWAWAFHCFLVTNEVSSWVFLWIIHKGNWKTTSSWIREWFRSSNFWKASKKMGKNQAHWKTTVLGGHQLGWSLGNEFGSQRFGTSAWRWGELCPPTWRPFHRICGEGTFQKGPGWPKKQVSRVSFRAFFFRKKTGKKIWWSMCSPFVWVQLQRH